MMPALNPFRPTAGRADLVGSKEIGGWEIGRWRVLVLAGWAAMAAAGPLSAQDSPPDPAPQDEVIVAPGEVSGASGRIAVNIVAGNSNQQLGDAVIAIGDIASASQNVAQRLNSAAPAADRATAITIGENAFSGNRGLVSINITAGSQNQSANLALLAVGNSAALSDQLLEQSRAPTKPNGKIEGHTMPANDRIAIGEGAFGEGSGLVQINLIGGEGNSSANTFALSVLGEGNP